MNKSIFNYEALTPENAAILFIDHQTGLMPGIPSCIQLNNQNLTSRSTGRVMSSRLRTALVVVTLWQTGKAAYPSDVVTWITIIDRHARIIMFICQYFQTAKLGNGATKHPDNKTQKSSNRLREWIKDKR